MSRTITPPCFDGFPRVMVRYGDDPQEIELFRAKKGQTLSQFEFRMMTRDLGSPTCKAHVRIAHATSLLRLDSPRPAILYRKPGGSYAPHRPKIDANHYHEATHENEQQQATPTVNRPQAQSSACRPDGYSQPYPQHDQQAADYVHAGDGERGASILQVTS